MNAHVRTIAMAGLIVLAVGCRSRDTDIQFDPAQAYLPFAQQVEYPDLETIEQCGPGPETTQAPPSLRSPDTREAWPLMLQEAVQIALSNSEVIRALGGTIVQTPSASSTVYDPAIQEADPRFGVEAALSAFDAQFATQFYLEQTDRRFNNRFIGSGTNSLLSNLGDFRAGISKTSATGTQFSLDSVTLYNRNDSPANLYPSVFDTILQGGFRQPLLQGSGVEFNRIAGPNATPGNYNGVLLARIRTDISLADFELAVRDLLQDVERTYWDLYFAYRDFDAKQEGRRLALRSWQLEKAKLDAGRSGVGDEAFAREQYYLAQSGMENALGGAVDGTGGIFAVERQLRGLLGLPASDGRRIVPADDPQQVEIRYDWCESLGLALTRRAELRKQQWQVKQHELELIAARNFERMRLDFVGQYRWRGFGDELLGTDESAYRDLLTGQLQDWRVGLELRTPIGNRLGHAAARHAELQLAREHAIRRELERRVSNELSGAFTELDRAYSLCRSRYNQSSAAYIRLESEMRKNETGLTRLELVLDAQRGFVAAISNYFHAVVDYELALMNLHFSRGTLLDNHQVYLAEGLWCEEAYASAAKLARRFRQQSLDYVLTRPGNVSAGPVVQRPPDRDGNPAVTSPASGIEPSSVPFEPVPSPSPSAGNPAVGRGLLMRLPPTDGPRSTLVGPFPADVHEPQP